MSRISKSRAERRAGMLFIAPAAIYMCVLVGYPIIYNFVMSFRNIDVMTFAAGSSVFVGFKNYRVLFSDPVFRQTLYQTFSFTIWCLIFQFSIGLALALFFNLDFHLSKAIRGLLVISWVLPMSVIGLLWKFMLGSDGIVNALLHSIGLIGKAGIPWLTDERFALWGVILTNCWVGIPFNMILLTTGLSNIPVEIYESGKIDGASPLQSFARITLPLLRPAIMAVLMLGFIYTFKIFDLIFIMTNGGPLNATQVLSTFAYRLSFTEYKFSLGAASAVVLFLCLMGVGIYYLMLAQKEESY